MAKTTTIEISIETYDKLRSVRTSLAKILRKKSISMDMLFKLFFTCQPLDVILMDMILEETPSVTSKFMEKEKVVKENEQGLNGD